MCGHVHPIAGQMPAARVAVAGVRAECGDRLASIDWQLDRGRVPGAAVVRSNRTGAGLDRGGTL